MPETKPPRGGARKGAGRPRVIAKEEGESMGLNLTKAQREYIEEIGNGNASAGARIAIDAHILAQQKSE